MRIEALKHVACLAWIGWKVLLCWVLALAEVAEGLHLNTGRVEAWRQAHQQGIFLGGYRISTGPVWVVGVGACARALPGSRAPAGLECHCIGQQRCEVVH